MLEAWKTNIMHLCVTFYFCLFWGVLGFGLGLYPVILSCKYCLHTPKLFLEVFRELYAMLGVQIQTGYVQGKCNLCSL